MYNMYPLMFNLQNKVVVIIGGGKIAYRKASGLKDTGAFVLLSARNLRGNEGTFLYYLEAKSF